MKVSMNRYEKKEILEIFEGEHRILSVNWNGTGVIIVTPEQVHILPLRDDNDSEKQQETASACVR